MRRPPKGPRRFLLAPPAAGVLALAVSVGAPPAAAQATRPPQDSIRAIPLDSLAVSVTRGTLSRERMPAAIRQLDAADIQGAQAAIGLDEALDRVPGVLVNNRYNFSLGARISMRGLGARAAFGVRGVRVLADGIPLTMPDGQSNLNNVDLGSAGRIEVLRGPASSLYGNAAGGVIAISSEPPPARTGVDARLLAGDAGRDTLGRVLRLHAKTGGQAPNGSGWLLSLSHLDTDGFRDFSRAEQTLLNAKGTLALDERSTLTLLVNAVDAPVSQSPGALPIDSVRVRPSMAWPNNVRTGSGEATTQVQTGLTWVRTDGADRFDIAVYGLGRNVDNALPFAFILLERRAAGLRSSWSGTPLRSSDQFAVTGGVDVEWSRDERREFNNVSGAPGTTMQRSQTDRVSTIGPFAQVSFRASERVDLVAGARYDAVKFATDDMHLSDGGDDSGDRTLSALSPMAGISWAIRPRLRLYGNVATAFQTPTTTELINSPPATGQPCCPGGFNVALDPQKARSMELGARGDIGDGITIDAAFYHMNVQNTIVPFQVPDGEGREFFRNAGESRHRGVEVAALVPIGRHAATLAWTFNDFVFLDDGVESIDHEGNRLPGIPRHHLFAGLRLFPRDEVRIDLEADHTGEYFSNDANEESSVNPAATVLDARLYWTRRFRQWRIAPFIAINNITDERYNASVVVNAVGRRYFEPAPGRNLHLGLSIAAGGWAVR
ncbi:MAG: TonB-dependent receptor [Gemmatimonadetes bacterium]|nr:TonB-dependent receptor [Gemmatimonadota bacterium]